MFGLKGRDTFNEPDTKISDVTKKAGKWWMKSFPYILMTLAIFSVFIIVYVWHAYISVKDVSEEEKTQYIEQKNSEISFKKEKFDELKSAILLREKTFKEPRVEYEDIFYHIKKEEVEEAEENE
ncbi:MAG: hypothetical protein ABFQ53_03535 [Patescibacteria group bacterium]